MTMLRNDIFSLITEERNKQKQKFGDEPEATRDGLLRILGEEFGEICKEVNQRKSRQAIDKEVLQLAAVCVAWLEDDLHDGAQ